MEKSFKIASSIDTVRKIAKDRCSIARFGDGELGYIKKIGLYFQDYNEEMAKRLKEVLNSDEENLLIGLPLALNPEFINLYIGYAKEYWTKWMNENEEEMKKILNMDKQYYSTQISRFYLDYADKSGVEEYVKELKNIWKDRDMVIIEGEKSRLGTGNDLFDCAKSVSRILGPAENAYDKYNEILEEAKKISKDKLILLALGPTATILAYDLHKLGYQAVDIGHVDIEYEWYLRKATTKIKIDGKYMGESGVMNKGVESKEKRLDVQDTSDSRYEKQIIAKIL